MKRVATVPVLISCLLLAACGEQADESTPSSPRTTAAPPAKLDVTSPRSGETVLTARRTVTGTADPGARVEVSGRDTTVVNAGTDGVWKAKVPLALGEANIGVTATKPGREKKIVVVEVTRRRSAAEAAEFRRARAAKRAAASARRARVRAAAAARRVRVVANFKASAKTIPYPQLEKNADRYEGDRVKFYGEIFQIQEDEYGGGTMLLSVTDTGYDVWDDNVWVNYSGTVKGAKGDKITVWGTMDGSRSYETQAGGETYVPEMTARYKSE